MKKIKYLIITLLALSFNISSAYASSATLSTNASTIENGRSVTATLTLRNVAAWNVEIASGGSTSGCTKKFVGDTGDGKNATKTFTVTCKATSIGRINFFISGDVTSADGTNKKISGSKNVTVVKPREKSTNNKLSSLSVKGYELSPAFDSNTNSYAVSIPSTIKTITIEASKADRYASIEGVGEKEVSSGINNFDVVVTSETGVSNIYKIVVNVEDLDPINVTINDKQYTVVKEKENLVKPELFEDTTVTIGEYEVPAFTSEVTNLTLVGLKDEVGKISLYLYDNDNYKPFNEMLTTRLNVMFLNMETPIENFTKTTININGESIIAYKNDFLTIVKALNLANGKEELYTYDEDEKTLQLFNEKAFQELLVINQDIYIIIYILSAAIVVLLLISILLYKKSR
ncbi:MAG TPA: cadherin-like beta sandwich domain-containing protein [Mollicutes bacterium]|nr:cadherin-like beta sandwich domain-containing protein [Mollicutes bacterium]